MYSLIPVVCAQDITALVRALPGSVAQGLIWGIMAIGVFLTFKILDFADLTVDGTMATGGVVTVMLILKGQNGQKKSRSLLVSTLSLLLSTRQIHDNLSFKLPQPFNTGHLL